MGEQMTNPYSIIGLSEEVVEKIRGSFFRLESSYIDYALEHVQAIKQAICVQLGGQQQAFKNIDARLEGLHRQLNVLQGRFYRPQARKDEAGCWIVIELCGDDTQHPLWCLTKWSHDFAQSRYDIYDDTAQAIADFYTLPDYLTRD